jgi:hypothetical protein
MAGAGAGGGGGSAGGGTMAGGGGSGDGSAAAGGGGSASGSADAIGTGSGSAGDSGSNHHPGSAGDSGDHKEPDSGVKFGEKLPDHWVSTGHQIDHVEEAPKDAKWTAEFAHYVFDYGIDDAAMPKDPKEYAAALDKAGALDHPGTPDQEKVTKTDKLKNGYYYESASAFRYVIDAGDKRIHCGGSFYKDADHDKIAKVRDAVIATAKKICASAKL